MSARALPPLSARAHGTRYLAIAASCAAGYNLIMIVGAWAGAGYLTLTLLAFAVLTPAAYLLHARYSFAEAWSARGLIRFTGGAATGLPLSLAVVAVFCSGLRLPVAVAAPIATGVLFAWNYLSARLAILGRLRAAPQSGSLRP